MPPRDPESKGVVERANGFLETSFMPGRTFTGPADYNEQLAQWLPRANSRLLRRTGEQPSLRVAADVAAMKALPPFPPTVGSVERVRLARDYYVRIAGNDYSVDPSVIGRFVDVHADLTRITVTCAGTVVATHLRHWGHRASITDPAHVATAKTLRAAYRARTAALRGPAAAGDATTVVAVRALSDYDTLFNLDPPSTAALAAAVDLPVAG